MRGWVLLLVTVTISFVATCACAADQEIRSISIVGDHTSDNLYSTNTGSWVNDITWTSESDLPGMDPRLTDFVLTGPNNPTVDDHMGAGGSSSSLYLGEDQRAWLRFADNPQFGRLQLKVYDRAASERKENSHYGPRWGVLNNEINNPIVPVQFTPQDCMIGAGITWKRYLDANSGYALATGNAGNDGVAADGFYASKSSGAPRRVVVQPTRTPDNDPLDTPVDGQGAWSTWVIEVHQGELYTITINPGENDEQAITLDGDPADIDALFINANSIFYESENSSKGFNELMLYGGQENVAGAWFDEITWIPDSGEGAFIIDFEKFTDICLSVNAPYGDFNCDHHVDLLDLTTLGENYNSTGLNPETSYLHGDTNADGKVNLLDLTTLGENYNTIIVPEPATLALSAIACLLLLRRP